MEVAVDAGHPVLVNEAVRTVRTWKFAEAVNASLPTSFHFELESRLLTETQNTRLEMELTRWIRVRAPTNDW